MEEPEESGPEATRGLARRRIGTFRALSRRNFRIYFIGQIISNSGTWMQTVAQSWLVLELTKSGVALGLVSAAQFLPILLLSPLAGVYVDRADKRRLLVFTQSAFALIALVLGIVVLAKVVALWMVFALAGLMGIVNAIDTPARQSFVIEMVGKKDLANAVSLNAVLMNSARVIGPAIAGAVIYRFGVGPNFIANAISYLAVIASLLMLRASELMPSTPLQARKGQLREGLRYVARTPRLGIPLLMMLVVGTLAYEFQVSLPLLTTLTFHLGAGAYAAITAALGAGAVVGGLAAATFAKPSMRRLAGAALVFGALMVVAALMPTFYTSLGAVAVAGLVSIIFLSTANALLQITSKPEMRGRVMALYTVAFLGTTPIGAPLVGYISQHFGGRAGILVGGMATVIAGALGALAMQLVRKRREDATQPAVA
ncbi:MAG: MFS transporter [Actinomycetota bacterium]|nr:MFS transporter [Actinomycetota bacterium]